MTIRPAEKNGRYSGWSRTPFYRECQQHGGHDDEERGDARRSEPREIDVRAGNEERRHGQQSPGADPTGDGREGARTGSIRPGADERVRPGDGFRRFRRGVAVTPSFRRTVLVLRKSNTRARPASY